VAGGFDGFLFDSDALSLLAAAGLLPHTLAVLGASETQVYRLESLSHMLRRGRIGKTWTPDTRTEALREVQRIQVWRHQPDAELLNRIIAADGVDDGEALLYASLVEHPTYLLVSGDKRSMRALCEAPDLRDIRAAISGRVICLETLLLALIDGHGPVAIGRSFEPVLTHVTLRVVFTATNMVKEGACQSAVISYFRELKGHVGEGFLLEVIRP
jgi:hypothetical protein